MGFSGSRSRSSWLRLELVIWLVMRGALAPRVKTVHRFYHVPASNTAVGHLILEDAP
jgi:protocatechuate 4,5-dioxygenase beta chain